MSKRFSNTPEPVERHVLKDFKGNIVKEYELSTSFEIYIHDSAKFIINLLNSKIWITKSDEPNQSLLQVQETYAKQMGLI